MLHYDHLQVSCLMAGAVQWIYHSFYVKLAQNDTLTHTHSLWQRVKQSRGKQRFWFCLTAAVLCALEAQLRVLVQAHAPQLDHIFGRGGDESEAVTTSSRRDLQQSEFSQNYLNTSPVQMELKTSLEPIRTIRLCISMIKKAHTNKIKK